MAVLAAPCNVLAAPRDVSATPHDVSDAARRLHLMACQPHFAALALQDTFVISRGPKGGKFFMV